jgi:DNA topoisomerase-1
MATNSRSKKDEKAVALEAPPTKAKGGRLNNGKAKKGPTGAKTSSSSGSSGRSRKSTTEAAGGTTNLVVVESPAKARTIERILGGDFVVKASQGHVRDLPKGKLGVDIEDGFAPSYSVLKDKQAVVQELKALGDRASSIYLATDPDREGEAISWHLVRAMDWDNSDIPMHRVVFHEITQEAVKDAFNHPRSIDEELVNAQQARRILDRLVGYQISPLLWRKVQRGLSAGRVQSVALRMVVEREKEIEAFVPREYWTIEARLQKKGRTKKDEKEPFTALLNSVKGQKAKLSIPDGPAASRIEEDLRGAEHAVAEVKKREVKQSPSPPFITSTLQQEAGRKLRFSAKRTMSAAQQLYEGLSIGSEGSVGLITYMRTDSTHVAPSALQEAREYIRQKFGEEYLPHQTRVFRKKAKAAQEAHEAIRPTSIRREPQAMKPYLSSDQFKLYDLIWRRMLASQIADARSDATTVDTEAKCQGSDKVYVFRATGSVLKFPGFRVLYLEGKDDADDEDGKGPLPELSKGEMLDCLKLDPKQHFTQPPPRFTEASLIKALEENGIGRPSTYAPIISTIEDRHYVRKEQGKLTPTILGSTVSDLLSQFFADIMDTTFTARMEGELDEVARGERQWVPMLQDFYSPFRKSLEVAAETMPRVKVEEATDEVCDSCGNPMVIKTGRFGRFMACSDFPTCKNTKRILNKIGVDCPRCGGDLVQRKPKGRGRKVFYGCSRYPDCEFILNQRPVTEPCPECGGLMVSSGQKGVRCTSCAWAGDAPQRELVAVET